MLLKRVRFIRALCKFRKCTSVVPRRYIYIITYSIKQMSVICIIYIVAARDRRKSRVYADDFTIL